MKAPLSLGVAAAVLGRALSAAADVVPIDKAVSADSTPVGQTAHLSLTWLMGLMILVALLGIGFKKSKRSHLD